MKKYLIYISTFLILSTSISFANPKEYTNKLDIIANSLDSLYLSIVQNNNTSQLEKKISSIESQVKVEKNNILNDIEKVNKDDKLKYLAMLSVLNYYEISIIQARDYYENTKGGSLVGAISSFAEGNTILTVVKSKLKI